VDDTGPRSSGLRALPQVQRLLEHPRAHALGELYAREQVVTGLRRALDRAREGLLAGVLLAAPNETELLDAAEAALAAAARPVLVPVINATGVILHTNLGRAPMPAAALEAVLQVGRGYSNLEFDLEAGARGSRTQGIEPLLRELTGAEAGLAVNNAAAAVLLALSALAGGGEVIVSRGELVEIGGGFRIPDVIRQGGARLVEVGTTNRTRLADYANAITPETRVLLKVHQSNYRVVGFTAEASLAELSGLARERGLMLMHDLGGGAMSDLRRLGRPYEPTARDSLDAGADLVAFSGDKLMGGPQAGLLAGRKAAIDPLRKHPLLRAVRLDKMTLAALEATLQLYRDPAKAAAAVPALAMLAQSAEALQARAERLASAMDPTAGARAEPSTAYTGGGTLPGEAMASWAVRLEGPEPETLSARLRKGRPAVVGRIDDGALVLDMLTVRDAELGALVAALNAALGG
jgi:L-seryl-tRNA(Ser) seleniumtransferase